MKIKPTDKKQVEYDLHLETDVREISEESAWEGEGVEHLNDTEVAEMTDGDESPMFVEFVALYEGLSNNDRFYTKEAVATCVPAMIGVNMYKGHQEPGTDSWKYREPVGRVVAAKMGSTTVNGKRVPAAIGKAYISEADPKLRADIKRKLAGNVSILGRARAVRNIGESQRRVIELHKPLKSVDFCNPGTGGLAHAGVVAVVREMSGNDDTPVTPTEETQMKLTIDQLKAEYGPELKAIAAEHIDTQISEMAAEKTAIAEERSKHEAKVAELEEQIQEMQGKIDTVTAERDAETAKFETERNKRVEFELKNYATETVAEMAKADGADKKLIDMAAKRVTPKVVDGDLDASKSAFDADLKAELETVQEMASMFGGTKDDDTTTTTKTANKKTAPKAQKADISKFVEASVLETKGADED